MAGCSVFTSPYASKPSYQQGEKQSYTITNIFSDEPGECSKRDDEKIDAFQVRVAGNVSCRAYAKMILTRPDTNVSYQFHKFNEKGELIGTITCVSPAEVAKALSTAGNIAFTLPHGASSVGVNGGQSTTEGITLIQNSDTANNIAAASFYNCVAYANGMYGRVSKEEASDVAASGVAEINATAQQTIIFKSLEAASAPAGTGTVK